EQVDSGSGGLDIVLERRAVVEGRVLRADTGEPVTDFELAHRDASRNRFVPTRFHTPVQDEQGRFRLELGPTRDAVVLARAKGFAEGSARTGELMEGKTVTGIEIRLEPAIRVEGVVRNRAGEPIAGALVFAGGVREALRLAHEQGVRSSDDGAFVLELDSSKTRHISATHPSYAPGSVEVRLSASGANQVKIVLSEGGTIEGTVFSDGRPVAYQEVHVYHRSGSKTEPETRTDADGRYRVTCVMPGERRVSAGFRNRDRPESRYRHMDQYGVVEEGRVTVVDFDFPPATATLELTIRVEGETPEQATARVSGAVETSSGVESLGFTASDSDGVCTIEDVPSGTVTLEVRARHADGGKLTETVTLEVADGETISRQIDLE
ncbi:MAG TPA: carboxypeptidase regulatory-like domain-containing protein, partial [Candidatus Hydrogenedentes bacterium]|nr:carboxypeptidase regulatory-like domain-containing protein [Candidatus Hydrogenedentota bacterium]